MRLIIGFVLSALIVAALVVVGMPYMIKNASFLMGVITGLVAVSLVFIIVFVRNGKFRLDRSSGDHSTSENTSSTSRTRDYTWIMASVFIILGGLVGGFVIFKQNEMFKTKDLFQRTRITQQTELIEATRIQGMVVLMKNVLDKVDQELDNNPKRTLTEETIGRIAALSYSFKPYTHYDGDSLIEKKFSPERAQLLLALSNMNIDTGSLSKIMVQSQFAGADLREAELEGAYLRKANLNGAALRGANLQGADLSEADLRTVDLWGANLRNADLVETDMKRADLRWADLSNADLKRAILNGVKMNSAILRKADLREALFQWANLDGVFLNEANLESVDFYGANLERAHLNDANLSKARFRFTNLSDANINGVDLSEANLTELVVAQKNWLNMLSEWHVTGASDIQKKYEIVDDRSKAKSRYRLQEIED